MKLEYKRRAIFTVLSEIITDNDLLDIMWHWQNNYSNKSHFELNHFLSDCKNYPEISDNRSWLYRKLIAIFVAEENNLKDDPWLLMQEYEKENFKTKAAKVNTDDNWTEIFSCVMNRLFENLRSDTQRSIIRYVIQYLTKVDLPERLAYSYHAWADERKLINTNSASSAQLKKLLNLTYIGLCEYVGPASADQFLSSAIQHAQFVHGRTPLDPRNLL